MSSAATPRSTLTGSSPRAHRRVQSLQDAIEEVTGIKVDDQVLRLGSRRIDQGAETRRAKTLREQNIGHGSTIVLNVGASEQFDTKTVHENLRSRAQNNRSGLSVWVMPRWQSQPKPNLVASGGHKSSAFTNDQVYFTPTSLCGDPNIGIRNNF